MNWPLAINSLVTSGAATVCALVAGICAALWAAGLEARWRALIAVPAVIALVLPPFLVTNCWIELLGERGVWHPWLPWNIYSLGGAVWILTLLTWPISFFLVSASWQRLQAMHLDADPLLEGNALLRWLLLPLARTAIVQAGVLTLVLALNNFAVPAILQVKVFPAEVWVRFNTTFDYWAAIKLSWPLVVAPFVLVMFLRGGDASWAWRADAPTARAFRRQLGRPWRLASGVVAVSMLVFSLGVPLWQLVGSAKTWAQLWPALAAGQSAIAHSLEFAGVSATVVVVLAVAASTMLLRRAPLEPVLWIAFFMPGVLLGIALIWIFNRPGLRLIYQSAAIVVLGYVVRYAALGWSVVARATRACDQTLMDVIRLEGATRWQTLRHAQWPQIYPAIASAWYVTYLLCLWDVETLVLIVPPGGESLSLRIFNLLHYGHNPQVNALCLLLAVLALLPLLVWGGISLKFKARRITALVCVFAAIASGCSQQEQRVAPVQSKFFSRVEIIGTRGTGVGEFNKPRSVAVDLMDNLYVVDMTGRVQKFSPDGAYILNWQMPQTDKGKPKGMCRDAQGNIVVIEPHYSRVNHFSTDGKLVAQWGVEGTNVGQLGMPRAAVVNSNGEIYVAEYTFSERVQRFSGAGGKFEGSFGRLGSEPGEFTRAEGLGIDAQQRLYVADSCNHRIEIFSPDGKFLRAHGKAGSGPGEFSYPYDVRIDSEGRQYVCEFGNSRLQIFDADDHLLEIVGGPGANPGQFSNPWAIALDSKGNLYVADSMNHRVQKFIRK